MFTYKILNNGYHIYKEDKLSIIQEEPYIPDKALTYEENAIKQIEELEASNKDIENEVDLKNTWQRSN